MTLRPSSLDAEETPCASSDPALAQRWEDLHPDDLDFAVMALEVLGTGLVRSYDEWLEFVDAALDLRPAFDANLLTLDLLRDVAIVVIRADDEQD